MFVDFNVLLVGIGRDLSAALANAMKQEIILGGIPSNLYFYTTSNLLMHDSDRSRPVPT
ncbi:hypothetical protein [Pontibacter amylolyticus]|uniref:hypothetical protein n=1 Tax=Pontibacter amylolyticus TaxID=1424080 RepID=UPI001667C657|nr:hypothetical protein [Pontibacter amylolyticus]